MNKNINFIHKCYVQGDEILVSVTNKKILIDTEYPLSIFYSFDNENCIKLEGVESSKTASVALDALFSCFTEVNRIKLVDIKSQFDDLRLYLNEIWIIGSDVHRDLFYQNNSLNICHNRSPHYPVKFLLNNGSYCPKRPISTVGEVYKRYIPWLEQTLSFRVFDMELDLYHFHKWMNEPDVDFFWGEKGSINEHTDYIISRLKPESNTIPIISCLDGKPFGYFEIYWSKGDAIAKYYQAEDFDRGWHVLIGDKTCRGKKYLTAWMPSISHYLFLDDFRTQRIVIEPRIDNNKMIKSLNKCGYAHLKTFDFPHKRAMLGMLNREHFFSSSIMIPQ